ncbi:uncharacterized protein K489DRAFT_6385 [Dissoconium aciculare CBS 342.82]|uniref:Uncharacterized protein n=1 Tax=Dissoconium aciculare CBS 342.82 TaxID=1314786 RepID=A0A6J3MHC8_9PEZI|nr:uncharacterized protein K489DRAFT_6385 [Dissoconium aciculare CBS 342.82]KAF1827094.1 hypothetical protein K489DRAFT_6385 [Dissoconium aciculare CBS 342.82]
MLAISIGTSAIAALYSRLSVSVFSAVEAPSLMVASIGAAGAASHLTSYPGLDAACSPSVPSIGVAVCGRTVVALARSATVSNALSIIAWKFAVTSKSSASSSCSDLIFPAAGYCSNLAFSAASSCSNLVFSAALCRRSKFRG